MKNTFTDLHNQALTMGEHIEQMREAYEALERERDALAAYMKRLEFHTGNLCVTCSSYDEPCNRTLKGFTTTACSDYIKVEVGHIKAQIAEKQCSELAAQVEEETIERCRKHLIAMHDSYAGIAYDLYKDMPRKYAKQAGNPNDCQCIVDGKPLNQCNECPR